MHDEQSDSKKKFTNCIALLTIREPFRMHLLPMLRLAGIDLCNCHRPYF